jgi:putative ATP-binding cassette transporter
MWQARTISTFLRVFLTVFALEYVGFGLTLLLSGVGWWPGALAGALPPAEPDRDGRHLRHPRRRGIVHPRHPPHHEHRRPLLRHAGRDDGPVGRLFSWSGRERRLAKAAVVFLILVNQAQVAMSVRLNFFNRDWFNAIQNKDEAAFWSLLFTVFLFWAFILIASSVVEYLVQSALLIRWRRWLTKQYVGEWLDGGTHYRMSLRGVHADNPDQRIAEDINNLPTRPMPSRFSCSRRCRRSCPSRSSCGASRPTSRCPAPTSPYPACSSGWR